MLWNGNLAYIFMPRTASRSLNAHFAATWRGPLFGTASPAQLREIKNNSKMPTFVNSGRGHDNLTQLAEHLYRYGRTLRQMRRIVFVVRNPYHLVRSNFFFLRSQAASGSTNGNALLASKTTFNEFVKSIRHPNAENWLKYNGGLQENIHILRFESLESDVRDFAEIEETIQRPLVHLNPSIKQPYIDVSYDDDTEVVVYNAYRILFELGHYSRREGI